MVQIIWIKTYIYTTKITSHVCLTTLSFFYYIRNLSGSIQYVGKYTIYSQRSDYQSANISEVV